MVFVPSFCAHVCQTPCRHSDRRRTRPPARDRAEGPGGTDAATAEMLSLSPRTVAYARRALAHEGRAAALPPPPLDHPRRARTLDGAGEAQLVRLACAPAPAGHSQWTLQLLADRLVELEVVDGISAETVRVTLQKTRCSLGRSAAGACPPRTTAISSAPWSRSWTPTNARWTLPARWCA